jgi:voltage-gated potassium channel
MSKVRQKLSLVGELLAPRSYLGLLISLFLLTLLSTGTADTPFMRSAVTALGFLFVMSVGVAVSRTKHVAYGMIIGGLVICFLILISSVFSIPTVHIKFLRMTSYVLAIGYIAYAAQIIIRDVFSGEVNANRICGAICFYVMIGVCFSTFFFTLDMHDPTSFKIEHFYDGTPKAGIPLSVHDRFTLFNYFSFCTLSTLGYGDITPVSQASRTFSWMEALFGQLYLSILVARLVGLHIAGATTLDARETNNLGKQISTQDP